MKKLVIIFIIIIVATIIVGVMFQFFNTENKPLNIIQPSENLDTNTSKKAITKDMAYEGVSNYCHSTYDWSIAEDNPSIMYVEMGDETESEYQVIFRSYTGACVYFYVDKLSGTTRLIEYVPNLDVESEAGTINLYDYLINSK